MFGTRRLAKRSIIGTKVCAPWTDGRFYTGVIQSSQTWPNGEEAYSVLFEDGYTRSFTDKDLVGPGFQSTPTALLKFGQRVYVTYNGREVSGSVIKHNSDSDEVLISIQSTTSDMDEEKITRRVDDTRLMPSRKSARLQDQGTDYSKLADLHPDHKKRPVSHVIDVPGAPAMKHSRRRKSPSPDLDSYEDGQMVCETSASCPSDPPSLDQGGNGREGGRDVMNDHMAAMVLTSLSCSPVSPGIPLSPGVLNVAGTSPCPNSSLGSSGIWGAKSESSTPSPPHLSSISTSAPTQTVFGSLTLDEGIELDDTHAYFEEPETRKRRASTRTVFKCTWPRCGKIHNTCSGIERHIRHSHLGPKETPGDSDLSDHEEEFYYTEIEVSVDTVTQTFADMYTSSPPLADQVEPLRLPPPPDHDYQKKDYRSSPLNIPHSSSSQSRSDHPYGSSYPSTALPVGTPGNLSRSLSWQSQSGSPSRSTKAQERLHQHQVQSPKTHHFLSSSPKNSPMHKKSRSEVKKCRKVYGMENRDIWCTQCKWKKACTRFMD